MKRDDCRLPAFLKRYFWDVRFEGLEYTRSRVFVMERLLEYGDPQAVHWMQRRYEPKAIQQVIKRSRALSARSANFWAWRYHVDQHEVRCLSKRFLRRRAQHWFV